MTYRADQDEVPQPPFRNPPPTSTTGGHPYQPLAPQDWRARPRVGLLFTPSLLSGVLLCHPVMDALRSRLDPGVMGPSAA